jgi:multidrug efflux pump subunit AcrA (membrane-fusion protein)
MEAPELPLYTGLSGFAKISRERVALSIPSSAVLSAAAGRGLVLVRCDNAFERRRVALGLSADGWTEIRDGLSTADEVLIEGHHGLRPGDRIEVRSAAPAADGIDAT